MQLVKRGWSNAARTHAHARKRKRTHTRAHAHTRARAWVCWVVGTQARAAKLTSTSITSGPSASTRIGLQEGGPTALVSTNLSGGAGLDVAAGSGPLRLGAAVAAGCGGPLCTLALRSSAVELLGGSSLTGSQVLLAYTLNPQPYTEGLLPLGVAGSS